MGIFLRGLFGGPLGGIAAWAASILAVCILLGGVIGAKSCTIQGLKTDVKNAEAERDEKQVRIDELELLTSEQNAKIEQIAADCTVKMSDSELAALRAMEAARRRASVNPGSGAKAMNAWFASQFSR